jgi:retron-type reverse transcriptase
MKNLILAYKKARKHKTKKNYVIKFEENLAYNLKILYDELESQTYKPKPLKTFVLRDPKTRKISVSDFRDRVIHHALCNIIEPIFDKVFIYDSCANRKRKGTLFALKRFERFQRKATCNFSKEAFCFKADIKHYFQEIDREILLKIIQRKIRDEKIINLIKLILNNFESEKGMPLGNLTSQFFANVYLNELDYFIKQKLGIKYYIRYVDDFVILNKSKEHLELLSIQICNFLRDNLKLELHKEKSKIISLSNGMDFVGFRNFYYFKLVRKRSINQMKSKFFLFREAKINNESFLDIFQGWNAHAFLGDNYCLRINLFFLYMLLINFFNAGLISSACCLAILW